ncbi:MULTISPECIES: LysR family transcriptional regulator [Thalassobaculum]|uniref:DNA-binding transcriptional regulator, LysR family n=3 Tax=Thalassobaculum TaxID=526215 RepID=A0A8G2BJ34_9PROT|nr:MULTISPECIES: LysR family transcriptional regulator [Thalassobaculum]SDF98468.1 DNA-binding transcriptional regulator, LysR family [Thalassobaculum litoreum DSM 18839]
MDWDKLRVFHAVAEAGSFTHAGETLNLSQSAVSRQISALEESLKLPLFHRHARGLILTEQGEVLYQTARDVFAKLATTEALLSEGKDSPKGPLRLTTTVALGSNWLAPRLAGFLELYPEIGLTVILNDSELDLSMRQADVAIRLTPPRQPDLIQRHLKTIKFHLYASPEYLTKHGLPKTPADLAAHRLVIYGETAHPPFPNVNWLLDTAVGHRGRHVNVVRLNNYFAMYRAVQTGLGIAALPDYMAREDVGLIRVIPDLEGPQVPTYFVYPEELRHSKRIMVLRDFLIQEVAKSQF